MGVSEAVQWWDEWQLRLLVLASLSLQYFLLLAASLRKLGVPGWFRFLTWLAYLGSDAVAVYALATLFNRHRRQDWVSAHGSNAALEAVWAPVLLLHLGGQDVITAYNIEDNELWTRHILTAVSQVTVACYVFWKSWPTDKRLLQAAILVFIPGILKCIEKPLALRSASINSLVNVKVKMETDKINSLEEYVQAALKLVHCNEPSSAAQSSFHGMERTAYNLFVDLQYPYSVRLKNLKHTVLSKHQEAHWMVKLGLGKTFMRLYTKTEMLPKSFAHSYPEERTPKERSPRRRRSFKEQMRRVKSGLCRFFSMCYDSCFSKELEERRRAVNNKFYMEELTLGMILREVVVSLTFVSIGLFHNSHREDYDGIDAKITYTLLSCTAALEYLSQAFIADMNGEPPRPRPEQSESPWNSDSPLFSKEPWPEQAAQYSLMGCFSRNRRHTWVRKAAGKLRCEGYRRTDHTWLPAVLLFAEKQWFRLVDLAFLERLRPMEHCGLSGEITELVHGYVVDGWRRRIRDTATYRAFGDNRGQLTLEREGRMDLLEWTLGRPFDESVLLWHLATDLCFHHTSTTVSPGSDTETNTFQRRRRCRIMSNYMAYLLYVNPEMLMTGTRRSIFRETYDELNGMLTEETEELTPMGEGELTNKILQKATHLKATRPTPTAGARTEEELDDDIRVSVHEVDEAQTSTTEDHTTKDGLGFVLDACALAEALMGSGSEEDGKKTWKVVEGVWVEMLCFSAGRCRGYLHAKSLGSGGEYLSYVWLLLHYMGMESLMERLHRMETTGGVPA